MRCYLVKAPNGAKRYAGTQADARATRDQLMESSGAKKKDVSIEEAEVPVPKADLIEFINGLCAEIEHAQASSQA